MAFGDARGSHWLILPLAGIVLMVAGYSIGAPDGLGPRLFAVGAVLTYVGVILAGLIGHIIWLVPFSLLLIAPFALVYWICSFPFRVFHRLSRRRGV